MKNIVILPTYNERDNISKLIENIFQAIKTDILVIDDNSPDGTGAIRFSN
jgi:dolichol-phosphate mannosyltransferase